ncbi:unnamed protein product [Pylaiella littoralis]
MATPFPRLPMLAIAIGLVSHSYSLTNLFPYVGYMVQHLGVTDDKDEAGYYAGYLTSALMVGRFVSSYFWGRFADRYGRLPVMYIGLCSIAILSVAFGLSTSFWWAVSCRFMLGAMNGLVAIAKCMISEVCGKEHEVVGMSFVTGCWSFGLVIGPAFGGLLAQPVQHFPAIFSESGPFGRFPYLLPNIVGASIALSGLPMVFFFLKETSQLDNGGNGSRDGFKPLPTTESSSLETPERDVEQGGLLEMTPLTQVNSFSDNDDEQLAVLLEGGSERPNSARAATNVAGDGNDKGAAAEFAFDGTGAVGVAHASASAAGAASAFGGGSGGDLARKSPTKGTTNSIGSCSGAMVVKTSGPSIDGYGNGYRQAERNNLTFGGPGNDDDATATAAAAADRCLRSSRAASGKPPSTLGRGLLDIPGGDNEGNKNNDAARGVYRDGGRRGFSGGFEKKTAEMGGFDEDGHPLERGGGASQTKTSAVWREFLVPIKLLQEKRVRAILFVYGLYSFSIIGFGELYPLWALSTVAKGGLDWTTTQIGQVLSMCGVGMLTFQLLVYPRLSKRIGVTKSQRWACILGIPVYACFPFISRLRESRLPLIGASVLGNFLSNVTATAVFINVALATNNAVEPSRRATLNGLSMTLGSLAKAAGPAFTSAIFAWSIDADSSRPFPMDYHLVFYLLAFSMAAVCWASWNVITGDPLPRTELKADAAALCPDERAEGSPG